MLTISNSDSKQEAKVTTNASLTSNRNCMYKNEKFEIESIKKQEKQNEDEENNKNSIEQSIQGSYLKSKTKISLQHNVLKNGKFSKNFLKISLFLVLKIIVPSIIYSIICNSTILFHKLIDGFCFYPLCDCPNDYYYVYTVFSE